jgi:uncharacterized cupin superfamily protein
MAFPRHYHLANEEAIYVLEGSGTLRIGREEGRRSSSRRGLHGVARGGTEGTHQLVNTSGALLRYPCFSTTVEPVLGGPTLG